MSALRLIILFAVASISLFADGGTLLFHRQAGGFDVSLFSQGDAIRAGVNDLSVMVQNADQSTVMDATVLLHLERKQDMGEIMRVTAIATHAKATNKLLYAATIKIPSTGQWRLSVDVSSGGKSANVQTEINVLPPKPPAQNYWPLVAMVPLLMIAFVINRKLRARFRARMHS